MKYALYTIVPLAVIILFIIYRPKIGEPYTQPYLLSEYISLLDEKTTELMKFCPRSDGFDFPVGKPDAEGYFDMQPFGKNNHLGEDWNRGFRNEDLGDPIYSISNGIVSFVDDLGGDWGRVVKVIHKLNDQTYVESLYSHLKEIHVEEGLAIKKGQLIGTMGNIDGRENTHLYFEIRAMVGMPIGGGYHKSKAGYLNPSAFIKLNRSIVSKYVQ